MDPAIAPTDDVTALAQRSVLRFPEPLETEYRRDYAERWLTTNRTAFVLGLLILAGFGVVDPVAAPHSLGTVLFLRFGLGCVGVVILLVLSTRPVYLRVMQPVSAVVVFLAGASIVAMEVVLQPNEAGYDLYIFGVVIAAFFGYAAPRLRFWWASAAGWALAALTLLVGVDHAVLHQERTLVAFGTTEALIVAANVIGMIAAYSIDTGLRRTYLQRLLVEREQARSEALLLNVLPGPIAERLKRGDDVVDAFDEVGVLFADLVGFTPYSARLRPAELVAFLNETFSRFDRLAASHNVEKIKTIGDGYMAVSGLPSQRPDDLECLARLALAMRDEVDRMSVDLAHPLQLRIGMHVGPVVAGVIGLQKFSYDLWGDTVNTASRMETHAPKGAIQVTDVVAGRLDGRFAFEGPRTVPIKGKGEMCTYLLLCPLGP